MKIGIPRALKYHEFGSKWELFFKEIGVEFIVSPKTDKNIYDAGIKNTLTDYCLPVKVFIGHALWLKERCDKIFIPRIKDQEKWIFSCPHIIALPDLINNTLGIDVLQPDFYGDYKSYKNIAGLLNKRFTQKQFAKINKLRKISPTFFRGKTIAIVGRCYYIEDPKLNLSLRTKLKNLGVQVVTSTDLNKTNHTHYTSHWTDVNKLVAAIDFYDKDESIDGIIYIKPFNCGPDFLVEDLIAVNKPFLVLTFDEHASETGLLTRLEAFLELI